MAVYAMYCQLFLLACLVATAKADDWDDFSNNLAADLAPILALFGEQTTKQFLSESTTLLDNLIFAMAPLGILTAIVSVIRVCGGPSLRAFIGRAQEGNGIAEAELCSSTSRDVCELYHNGAIVRVFGRPKILEIVHDSDEFNPPSYGIYSSQHYISKVWKRESKKDDPLNFGTLRNGLATLIESQWQSLFSAGRGNIDDIESRLISSSNAGGDGGKQRETSSNAGGDGDKQPETSSNAGGDGVKQPETLSNAGGDGVKQPETSSNAGGYPGPFAPSPNLSFNIGIRELPHYVLLLAGIVGFLIQAAVLVFAYLVTYTWHWKKNHSLPHNWAFPFMIVGTLLQSSGMFFCAFLISNSTEEKVFRRKEKNANVRFYVIQPGNQIVGDQTFDSFLFTDVNQQLTKYTTSRKKQNKQDQQQSQQEGKTLSCKLHESGELQTCLATGLTLVGFILQFIGLRAMHSSISVFQLGAILLMSAIRAGLRTQRLGRGQNLWSDCPDEVQGHELDWLAFHLAEAKTGSQPVEDLEGHRAHRVFSYRARLAELTTSPMNINPRPPTVWDGNHVHVRLQAEQLKKAIDSSASIIFSQVGTRRQWIYKEEKTITVAINVLNDELLRISKIFDIELFRHNEVSGGKALAWEINQHQLEAVIGLWVWSIKEKGSLPQDSGASAISASRIMATGATFQDIRRAERELALWTADFASSSQTEKWGRTESLRMVQMGVATLETARHKWRRYYWWPTDICDPDAGRVLLTWAANPSMAVACAHHVYLSFLISVLDVLNSVGGKTELLRGSSGYSLRNSVIDRLIECFQESGLGSAQDAHSVISSAFRYRPKISFSDNNLDSVCIFAEDSRKEGDFVNAELVLKLAWDIIRNTQSTDHMARIMLELGELYRYALFSDGNEWKTFGREGIFWMKKATKNEPSNSQAAIITGRYVELERLSYLPWAKYRRILDITDRDEQAHALWRISRDKDLSVPDSTGRTVLSRAAQKGWSEIVKATLDLSVFIIDKGDDHNRTPLSYAAENGHNDIVKMLLKRGASPIDEDCSDRTPLSYAVDNGHIDVMESLLKEDRVSVLRKDRTGQSLLHLAAKNGQCFAMEWLLRHGADVLLNSGDLRRDTALIVALSHCQAAAVEYLVRNGAIVSKSIEKTYGWKQALKNGEWACIVPLLSKLNKQVGEKRDLVVTIGSLDQPPKDAHTGTSKSPGSQSIIVVRGMAKDGHETTITMDTLWAVINGQCSISVEVARSDSREDNTLTKDQPCEKISDDLVPELVELLLNQLGETVEITESVLLAAVSNQKSGAAITRLLLGGRTKDDVESAANDNEESSEGNTTPIRDGARQKFPITPKVVQAAAENQESGVEILKLLLSRTDDTALVTEGVILSAVNNQESGEAIIILLLQQAGHEANLTDEIVQAAADHWGCGDELVRLFLRYKGDQVQLTEDIMQTAARNGGCGDKIMKLFLQFKGEQFKPTRTILQEAAGNWGCGDEIIRLFLDHRRDHVLLTDMIVQAAVENKRWAPVILRLFLKHKRDQVNITKDLVRAVAENPSSGEAMMRLLLDDKEVQVEVTQAVVEAAAENSTSGEGIMRLLLDRRFSAVEITDEVIVKVVSNGDSGENILELLLDRKWNEVKAVEITPALIILAAGNLSSREVITRLLLDGKEDTIHKIVITPKLIIAAANNWDCGEKALRKLLKGREHGVKNIDITEGIVAAAVKNWNHDGEAILRLLLKGREDKVRDIKITEDIVIAATNQWHGKQILDMLLKGREHEAKNIQITEGIVATAVGYWNYDGEAILKLLLEGRKNEAENIEIMEKVVMAAMESLYGVAIMEVLREGREEAIKKINITDAIVIAAAEGWNGDTILKLLLAGREGDIKKFEITEAIVIAAAKGWNGEAILKLLLEGREDEAKKIKITEAIVIAAAKYPTGEAILKLLSDGNWNEFRLTKDIRDAIEENGDNGEAIEELLQYLGVEEVADIEHPVQTNRRVEWVTDIDQPVQADQEIEGIPDTEQAVQADPKGEDVSIARASVRRLKSAFK